MLDNLNNNATIFEDLLTNTFNQVNEVLGDSMESLDFEEFDDQIAINDIDMRLDSDSVLIEDNNIKNIENTENVLMNICNDWPNEVNIQNCFDEREHFEDTNVVESLNPFHNFAQREFNEFTPVARERCNTWPRLQTFHSENSLVEETTRTPSPPLKLDMVSEEEDFPEDVSNDQNNRKTKQNMRRNPWGNFSYSQIIAQAIQTSSEKRLTLSQIYDWMVANIPYFQDRSDQSSSAGWKNSIRHNLSLHQKFVKVQNEGPGKSSWWMINPEKPAPPKPRRRSTLGDSKSMSAKRERARKKMEQLNDGYSRLRRCSSFSTMSPPSSPVYDDTFVQEINSPYSKTAMHSMYNMFEPKISPRLPILTNAQTMEYKSDKNEEHTNSHTEDDNVPRITNGVRTSPTVEGTSNQHSLNLVSAAGEKTSSFHENKKIKILEPRQPICSPINAMSEICPVATQKNLNINDPDERYVKNHEFRENIGVDEVRRPLIIRELNQLTKSKEEMFQNKSTKLTSENKQVLESTFDLKIKLLQGELDKITREDEIRTINFFSRASNNPFFKHGLVANKM